MVAGARDAGRAAPSVPLSTLVSGTGGARRPIDPGPNRWKKVLLVNFTQTITVEIPDVTDPPPAFSDYTSARGVAEPRASNQIPDGFSLLTADDNLDPDPMLRAVDSGSGTDVGPYPSGTTIKYTEAPGAPPSEKSIGSANGRAGAVAAHLTGPGDAVVYATDVSGNVAEPARCLVPPPPR